MYIEVCMHHSKRLLDFQLKQKLQLEKNVWLILSPIHANVRVRFSDIKNILRKQGVPWSLTEIITELNRDNNKPNNK